MNEQFYKNHNLKAQLQKKRIGLLYRSMDNIPAKQIDGNLLS
jgi:hypothetical protein